MREKEGRWRAGRGRKEEGLAFSPAPFVASWMVMSMVMLLLKVRMLSALTKMTFLTVGTSGSHLQQGVSLRGGGVAVSWVLRYGDGNRGREGERERERKRGRKREETLPTGRRFPLALHSVSQSPITIVALALFALSILGVFPTKAHTRWLTLCPRKKKKIHEFHE